MAQSLSLCAVSSPDAFAVVTTRTQKVLTYMWTWKDRGWTEAWFCGRQLHHRTWAKHKALDHQESMNNSNRFLPKPVAWIGRSSTVTEGMRLKPREKRTTWPCASLIFFTSVPLSGTMLRVSDAGPAQELEAGLRPCSGRTRGRDPPNSRIWRASIMDAVPLWPYSTEPPLLQTATAASAVAARSQRASRRVEAGATIEAARISRLAVKRLVIGGRLRSSTCAPRLVATGQFQLQRLGSSERFEQACTCCAQCDNLKQREKERGAER